MPTCDNCGRDISDRFIDQHQKGGACQNHNTIVRLYLDGNSYRDVADEIELDKMTVYRHLDALGLMRTWEEVVVKDIDIGNLSNDELAWFCGTMLGDGYIRSTERSDYKVGLNVTDKSFSDRFSEIIRKIGIEPSQRLSERDSRKDVFQVSVDSRELVQWWESLEWSDITAVARSSPAGFVRGFYDSDGHLTIKSNGVNSGFTNTNTEMLDLIENLILEATGIEFGARQEVNTAQQLVIYNHQEIHELHDWMNPTIPRKDIRTISE